jgi:outer membrane protein OmpA-like peptidoglycan-associated protein
MTHISKSGIAAAALLSSASLLMFTGCTSKNYVRSQTAPLAQKTNELDDATAANNRNLQDVTARTDAGIAHAQGAADTANQNAMSASNSASHAQATAQDAVNRANTLEGAVIGLDSYQTLADVSVLFGFGKDQLTSQGKKQLDQVGTQVATSRGYLLEITGATDSVGGADYNYQLSERRAQAVVQYLATKYNIAPHKFYLIGLGKDQAKATRASARAKDRKVEVRLLSNKPGQSTAPATVASGAY